jgi:hypothetical protein
MGWRIEDFSLPRLKPSGVLSEQVECDHTTRLILDIVNFPEFNKWVVTWHCLDCDTTGSNNE